MADLNYRPAAEIEFPQPDPAAPQGDSLRFEQRRESRHHALGSATAFLLDPEHFGVTHALTLADRSDHGLGAFSAQPLPLGATVTLGFSGFDMFARRAEWSAVSRLVISNIAWDLNWTPPFPRPWAAAATGA